MRNVKPIAKLTARIADKAKAAPKRKAAMIKSAQSRTGKKFI